MSRLFHPFPSWLRGLLGVKGGSVGECTRGSTGLTASEFVPPALVCPRLCSCAPFLQGYFQTFSTNLGHTQSRSARKRVRESDVEGAEGNLVVPRDDSDGDKVGGGEDRVAGGGSEPRRMVSFLVPFSAPAAVALALESG